jgi:hypothetical protein
VSAIKEIRFKVCSEDAAKLEQLARQMDPDKASLEQWAIAWAQTCFSEGLIKVHRDQSTKEGQ